MKIFIHTCTVAYEEGGRAICYQREGAYFLCRYGVRNLDMSIRISLKSRPSERFPRPEMSQIKAEISLHSNVKLNCNPTFL